MRTINEELSDFGIQTFDNALVFSLSKNPSEIELDLLRNNLVRTSFKRQASWVIFDFSSVLVMSIGDFNHLYKTEQMIHLMGKRTIYSGMTSGLVSTIVYLDIQLYSKFSSRNLSGAFDIIRNNL